ncbi:zinc ribbon domain-containing protein [Gorillibacterium massiliense]|uniref:zinc ribbon domain-containing protein n=1 Tax=Gorillibacterium massiliense TaxID=1280390 RepID=UPI0004B798FE|nr:zinc-ribbon domain-containing protein [Gorillibacterium massiliense]
MGYCNHCGSALPPESLYCPECGTKVENDAADFITVPQAVVRTPRKPINRKMIWWLGGIVAAVIILVGLYMVGASLSDKDRMLHQFEAAVKAGDSGKLEHMLVTDDKGITGKKMAESLISANKNYPSFLSDLMTSLKAQSKQMDSKGKSKKTVFDLDELFGEGQTNTLLTLKKQGKSLLLYDRYVLQLQPYRLSVTTNLENTAIYVDGVQVGTVKGEYGTQEVEGLLPGLHKVKATYTGDFASFDKEEGVDLFSMADQHAQLTLNLPGDFVYLKTNYDGAAVYYLDDKDVTSLVREGKAIGPIAYDGTHKAVAEVLFPWGKMKSDEVVVDQMYNTLTINPLSAEVKDQIMAAVASFYKSWALAYTSFDPSQLKNVDADWAMSLTDSINESKEAGDRVIITSKSITFDLDSFDLQENSDGYRVSVDARNLDNGISYNNTYSEAPPASDYENDRTFKLAFRDKEWKVLGASTTYYFNDAHTKVINNP